tara:strand:+ start:313 stop:513 length:201 start_codon:yes stop_codon:yes gene_type:complete
MQAHKALHICNSNDIKVYPIISNSKFKVEVDNKGEIITYDKTLTAKELLSINDLIQPQDTFMKIMY